MLNYQRVSHWILTETSTLQPSAFFRWLCRALNGWCKVDIIPCNSLQVIWWENGDRGWYGICIWASPSLRHPQPRVIIDSWQPWGCEWIRERIWSKQQSLVRSTAWWISRSFNEILYHCTPLSLVRNCSESWIERLRMMSLPKCILPNAKKWQKPWAAGQYPSPCRALYCSNKADDS